MSSLVCNITTKLKSSWVVLQTRIPCLHSTDPGITRQLATVEFFQKPVSKLNSELCWCPYHENVGCPFSWTWHKQPAGYHSFVWSQSKLMMLKPLLLIWQTCLKHYHENAAGLSLDENFMSPFSWTCHNPPSRLLWKLLKSQSVSWTLSSVAQTPSDHNSTLLGTLPK